MKPISLTPRAARWLHGLIHTPGLGVRVDDLEAAAEAVTVIDAALAELPPERSPAATNGLEPSVARGAKR